MAALFRIIQFRYLYSEIDIEKYLLYAYNNIMYLL